MPVKRKQHRRRRLAVDAETILADKYGFRRELSKGSTFFAGAGSKGNIDVLRDAWDAVRDVLLPQWIAENPGTRPFAWWIFDHKQERPVIGEPASYWNPDARFHGFRHTRPSNMHDGTSYQEPETDYLRRHGLLSDEELNALQTIHNAEAAP